MFKRVQLENNRIGIRFEGVNQHVGNMIEVITMIVGLKSSI